MRGDMVGEGGDRDILMEDLEGILREINEFAATSNPKLEDISPTLNRYLQYVAKSGNVIFPWQHVRPLFRSKILLAMEEFPGEQCPNSEAFVMEKFDLFRAAPFTIQRLTELVMQPTRHYKKKEKFLRGLEKTVLVVSTVEPTEVLEEPEPEEEEDDEDESMEESTEHVHLKSTMNNSGMFHSDDKGSTHSNSYEFECHQTGPTTWSAATAAAAAAAAATSAVAGGMIVESAGITLKTDTEERVAENTAFIPTAPEPELIEHKLPEASTGFEFQSSNENVALAPEQEAETMQEDEQPELLPEADVNIKPDPAEQPLENPSIEPDAEVAVHAALIVANATTGITEIEESAVTAEVTAEVLETVETTTPASIPQETEMLELEQPNANTGITVNLKEEVKEEVEAQTTEKIPFTTSAADATEPPSVPIPLPVEVVPAPAPTPTEPEPESVPQTSEVSSTPAETQECPDPTITPLPLPLETVEVEPADPNPTPTVTADADADTDAETKNAPETNPTS